MKKKNLLLTTAVAVALSTSFTACKKKEGCTDPAATNYDADAKKDDGSCEYPTSNNDNTNNSNEVVVKDAFKFPLQFLFRIPIPFSEHSFPL